MLHTRGRFELEGRRRNDGGRAQHHGARDDAVQLAYVAGPPIRPEGGEGIRTELPPRPGLVPAFASQRLLGEQLDVLAAVAQRRKRQRDHREPVVEILAEAPRPYKGLGVLVRRADDAGVDGLVPRRAEPSHARIFHDLQQLGLEQQWEQGDLVEEQRAAMGHLDQARLRLPGIRECAALVSEQFGLEERLGDGRAVHLDEPRTRSRAALMDDVRDQPLAGARLAGDHDRRKPSQVGFAREQGSNLLAKRGDLCASTDQIVHRSHGSIIIDPSSGQI